MTFRLDARRGPLFLLYIGSLWGCIEQVPRLRADGAALFDDDGRERPRMDAEVAAATDVEVEAEVELPGVDAKDEADVATVDVMVDAELTVGDDSASSEDAAPLVIACAGDCDVDCREDDACHADCRDSSGTCAVDCRDSAVCEVDCQDANNCEVECRGESTCTIDCRGANNCKPLHCTDDAVCYVDCRGANNCDDFHCERDARCYLLCDEGDDCGCRDSRSCGGGLIACNDAPCPNP